MLLLDPMAGKIEYGALSNLVTRLLREWVEKQIEEKRGQDDRRND